MFIWMSGPVQNPRPDLLSRTRRHRASAFYFISASILLLPHSRKQKQQQLAFGISRLQRTVDRTTTVWGEETNCSKTKCGLMCVVSPEEPFLPNKPEKDRYLSRNGHLCRNTQSFLTLISYSINVIFMKARMIGLSIPISNVAHTSGWWIVLNSFSVSARHTQSSWAPPKLQGHRCQRATCAGARTKFSRANKGGYRADHTNAYAGESSTVIFTHGEENDLEKKDKLSRGRW